MENYVPRNAGEDASEFRESYCNGPGRLKGILTECTGPMLAGPFLLTREPIKKLDRIDTF
jgi:hypothetical protein